MSLVSSSLTNLGALNKIQQLNSYMYEHMHKGKNKTKERELILQKDVELPSL